MKFNEKLKALREAKGYTQDEIASRLNIARQSVSKWEQGINEPDFDTLKKLCTILDCSIAELIDDDKEVVSSKEEKREKTANKLFIASLILSISAVLTLFALIIASNDVAIIHFDFNGNKKYGSKWWLLIGIAVLLVGVGFNTFIKIFVSKNDKYKKYNVAYMVLALVTNVVLVAVALTISGLQVEVESQKALNLVGAVLFSTLIGLGPFTHPKFNKRNPIFGYRSNLTISNEYAWNKVNAFASIILTVFSLIGYALILVFIDKSWALCLIGILLVSMIPLITYHEIIRKRVKEKNL